MGIFKKKPKAPKYPGGHNLMKKFNKAQKKGKGPKEK